MELIAFLWKYLIGGWIAEAKGVETATYNGVEALKGYNWFNTAVYVFLALLVFYGIKKLFKKYSIEVDEKFALSLVPWMLLGGALRALEDTATLGLPWKAALFTPFIYFTLIILALGTILIGKKLETTGKTGDFRKTVAAGGTASFILVLLLLVRFGLRNGFNQGVFPLFGVPILAVSVGLALQALASRKFPETFLNSSIGRIAAASHILDGSVTAVSVSSLDYVEKHVVSNLVIELSGTPYAFLALKTAVIFLVLGLMPREGDRRFKILLIIAVTAVALGPAVRNLLRAVLGI